VAQGVMDASGNKVKAGVYHSDVTDAQKERLHVKWRSGEVQVVCATIGESAGPLSQRNFVLNYLPSLAFGLGIDKVKILV
jgi:ATP-dependent DNA helicase Q1